MTAQLEIFRLRKARRILAESTDQECIAVVCDIDDAIGGLQYRISKEEATCPQATPHYGTHSCTQLRT